MIVLTTFEQKELQKWIAETASIASRSTCGKIALKPPEIEVKEVPNGSLGWEATASGGKITISRDCLGAPMAIMKYLIAHELGHEEGRHPMITFGAGLFILLPIMIVAVPSRWLSGPWPLPVYMALAIIFLMGVAGIVLYRFSMLFEWNADKRAARMIGSQLMIQGANLIQQKRADSLKFYQNKISKLNGGSPSMWIGRAY